MCKHAFKIVFYQLLRQGECCYDPLKVADLKQKVLSFLKVPTEPRTSIQILVNGTEYSIICTSVPSNITQPPSTQPPSTHPPPTTLATKFIIGGGPDARNPVRFGCVHRWTDPGGRTGGAESCRFDASGHVIITLRVGHNEIREGPVRPGYRPSYSPNT